MARSALFLCGDVMTGRGVDQILPHPSSPELYEPYLRDAREYVTLAEERSGPIPHPVDFEYVWGEARLELRRRAPDARIVNLETSVTRSDIAWPDKGINYRMEPHNVPCLTAAEIDVCVLANNHVLDWGRAGLVETLETLRGAGIETAGAGRTETEAEEVAIVDITTTRRVLVAGLAEPSSGVPHAWGATTDGAGIALLRGLGDADAYAVADRFARVRQSGDLTVASIHWGSNWGYEVPEEHVRFAHLLLEHGIDVVHGHSSHHPRPIEIYRGKPILYGCGDFVTDYEGIGGHEPFRDDLALMYFLAFDDHLLAELRIVPMRLRKMRLERASRSDVASLRETLSTISWRFGTEVRGGEEGSLLVESRAR
jgi:poly-gamma-glutamate synthesis protein (capsule biosynthesis protein)